MTATSRASQEDILNSLRSELRVLLKDQDVPTFLEEVTIDYIETSFRDPLEATTDPFVLLQGRIQDHLSKRREQVADDVYFELGTRAKLSDIEERLAGVKNLLQDVKDIVLLLEDMIMISLEHDHVEGFVAVYEKGGLGYQRTYFQ